MKITTSYVKKPIPDRSFDWSAVDMDTYAGPGSSIGYGTTEKEAVKDLIDQMHERNELTGDPAQWCGKNGLHYCGECGNEYDRSYDQKSLDKECPDHMKCLRCRY